MLKKLYPKEYYDSTYSIDFKKYYDEGYKGIIFDIDNTMVEHGAPANDKTKELVAALHNIGFNVCFLSNNKEPRVVEFNKELNAEYIFKAGKPSPKGYALAMEKIRTKPDTTLFVGDQIFTDIWGANNANIRSILVKPINKKEEIQIVLKRIPEKIILFFYLRKNKLKTK